MAQPSVSDLMFTVRRRQPELITPAKSTPHEFKLLSDIDDQDGLRCRIPAAFFYPYEQSMQGKDPAQLIRKALAQALVFYYPLAGRLREGPGRKLMVDCNEEGVVFIEADADVTIHQFGDPIQPPFPCFEELLYNVPGLEGIINCPPLVVQVTRLKCGGFVLAYFFNHTMWDGHGIAQFFGALAEIARSASEPSVTPVWCRELLNARDPPRVTCTHHEYTEVPDDTEAKMPEAMVQSSFFFGPDKLKAIRQLFSEYHGQYTVFEAFTAFLWRCRTISLQLEPDQEIRLMCISNVRGKTNPPLLPIGYYGNGFVYPAAVTTANKLTRSPLVYALELVKKAKGEATVEYIRSVADLMVIRGRPCFNPVRSWIVSNLTRSGLRDIDFGWGKAIYAGPAMAGAGSFPGVSFFVACKNAKGEEGITALLCLPRKSMEIFAREIDNMLSSHNDNVRDSKFIMSCL
ncbi:benzyl alcohol O-benzoyltransferase-like [Neltuma alba]|uniref:benzyl alcohol O-benzoyltransferase-like n=1 Tax=Neltuma alba TaxID=207710 RepID=UPI0010A3195D|nr:benzyl alcohol O-benzoyltransferase-like [Prosopis alba]